MPSQVLNGVRSFYGPRTAYEGYKGEQGRRNDLRELVIAFDGANYGQVSFVLPKGSTIVGNALVEINESFAMTGTTPTIAIGVTGSQTTNSLAVVSQTQAQSAAGSTYSIAPAGTLAANTPLAADTTITVALGGTTPTVGAGGKLKMVIPYKLI